MTGLRTRKILNDYGRRQRVIFLRAPWYTRFARWIRQRTFGAL